MSRRMFLLGSAGAAGGFALTGVTGCTNDRGPAMPPGSSGTSAAAARTGTTRPGSAIDPKTAPFDTVVWLMMENRSYDHMLGWLPGADGKQAGLSFVDAKGKAHPTYPLAPDYQGCSLQDPFHDWKSVELQRNGGACDGFLKTQIDGDTFPIGYYTDADLPILAAIAQNYTCFDQYFCSMLGPTWPNRLYQWCATTDLSHTGLYPTPDDVRPVKLETAIFDRVREAGLTGGYYSFAEGMHGLFASKKYDDIAYPFERFVSDAKAGTLPHVTFLDPDYSFPQEYSGKSNDQHPYGSVQTGDAFIAQIHDLLAASPQWDRMVFVVNYDEHGGFYDHVAPPTCEDDTALPGPGPHPDLRRLGFRVPCIAMGPFAPRRIVTDGPFEHCSVLKMIEWRWGLKAMTTRDATARNLADALDFSTRRPTLKLPAFIPAPLADCPTAGHYP